MALVIKGSTSGQITIDVPAEAGTRAINLPAVSGNILTDGAALPAIDGSALTGLSGDISASSVSASNNSNGYIKFSNNFVIQWLRKSSVGTQSITYPLAMDNYYGAYAVAETAGGAYLRIHSIGTTSISVGNGGANVTGWVLVTGRKT
jgi:hypothetical protein